MDFMIAVGIGQDSHAFLKEEGDKRCIIGGVEFQGAPGWDADSDGDIVYHAVCNAISSITHKPILGGEAIVMCHQQKITDSAQFLLRAKETLGSWQISHVALSIEAARPRLQKSLDEMRSNVARLLDLHPSQVGITVTSGDGLTDFGRGLGGQCFCSLTCYRKRDLSS